MVGCQKIGPGKKERGGTYLAGSLVESYLRAARVGILYAGQLWKGGPIVEVQG